MGYLTLIDALPKPLLRCTTLTGYFRQNFGPIRVAIVSAAQSACFAGGAATGSASGTARNVMDSRSPRYSPSNWLATGSPVQVIRRQAASSSRTSCLACGFGPLREDLAQQSQRGNHLHAGDARTRQGPTRRCSRVGHHRPAVAVGPRSWCWTPRRSARPEPDRGPAAPASGRVRGGDRRTVTGTATRQ